MQEIVKRVRRINESITITTGSLQTIFERGGLNQNDDNTDEIALAIFLSNNQDLTAFTVAVKFDPDAAYAVVAAVEADYTNPVFGGFIKTSGVEAGTSLVTLTKNKNGYIVLGGLGVVDAVRIQATAAGSGAILTLVGKMR